MKTIKNRQVKSKLKKKIMVMVASLYLITPPAYSGGWPVIDISAIMQSIKNAYQDYQHYEKIYRHYKQQVEEWKNRLQGKILGFLSKFDKVEPSKEMTEDEIKEILNKRRQRCNILSNSKSKQLCLNDAKIDQDKIELYYAAERRISADMRKLDNTWKKYQDMVKNRSFNDGKNEALIRSVEEDIKNQLMHIENVMTMYDRRVKLMEAKQELIQKARVVITREQFQGAYSTAAKVAKAGVHAAIIETLDLQANSYKQKAEQLRKKSSYKSNNLKLD